MSISMSQRIFRGIALVLGCGFVVFGALMLYRYRWAVPIRAVGSVSMMGVGLYFLNYSIFSRSKLFSRRDRKR